MVRTRARASAKPESAGERSWQTLEWVLLAVCLGVMALRATYTEAPTVSASSLPGNLSDTVYSLTLSGLLIGAPALWFVWGVCLGRIRYRFTGIEIGLGLFLAAGVVSAFGATDKRLAISHMTMLASPVAAAILLVQILTSTSRIRLPLLVVAALGVVSAYQCAEQRLVSNEITIEQYEEAPETLLEPLGIDPGTFQHFLFEHRLYSRGIRGFFTTSNSAASFGLLAAFAALALLLEQSSGSKRGAGSRADPRLYRVIAMALVVAGLVLTRSKGGILGFLVAVALFGLWALLRRRLGAHRKLASRISWLVALILVVGIGYGAISYGLEHGRLPGGNSMLVRWQYWRASAAMYADHALTGVGPGNFSHNYPRYKPAAAPESVADPHCFPLSVLCQYGPLGLLGFLVMVFVPVWRSTLSVPREGPAPSGDPPSSRKQTLTMLATLALALLVLRPLLIPTTSDGSGDLLLYEIIVLYVAPVAAFIIGYLLLATPLVPQRQTGQGRDWTLLTTALGCSVLGVLIHNLIDFAIFEPGVWTGLWLVIACLIGAANQRSAQGSVTRSCPPALRLVAVVAALGLAGLYLRYVWQPARGATTRMQQAQEAASVGQFERAHDLLDAAFATDPLSAAPLNLNGRLYLQEYEYGRPKRAASLEKAAEYFRQAVEVNPADYKNYEKAGDAYRLLGRSEEAYKWYAGAAERYPGCGRLHYRLGESAERLDAQAEARTHYQRAVTIEDAFRKQFREMYPEREKVVSRLGEDRYQRAKTRIAALPE